MNEIEFNNHFEYLQGAFSFVKKEKAQVYFLRFSNFDANVFSKACKNIVDSDNYFPSIARLLSVVVDLNARKNKENEVKERSEEMTHIGTIIQNIPFPEELKEILSLKLDGKITQEELEEKVNQWQKDNPDDDSCPRNCNSNGELIYYKLMNVKGKEIKQDLTARCDCKRGKEKGFFRLPLITRVIQDEVPF